MSKRNNSEPANSAEPSPQRRGPIEYRDLGRLLPFRLLQASSGFHSGPVLCRRQASFEVADQNHVARLRAAREGELLAVGREVEPKDLVGLEIGQLYRLPAVQRQQPDLRDAVNRVYVVQGAPRSRLAAGAATW
jgi:hypothetical protein